MTVCLIRYFSKTLSCLSSSIRRHDIASLMSEKHTNSRILSSNVLNDIRWRYFCINSSEIKKEHVDIKENAGVKEGSCEKVKLIFKDFHGELVEINAEVGQTVMKASQDAGIDISGACGGELTCTTCHVYVDEECEKMLEEPSYQEEDLLDGVPFVKPNSRLSCQIIVTKELEGRVFTLPIGTKNFAVDGHVAKPH